jgi:ubiquinone/menaquinone biosynthesis C-methylase UbiE
MEKYRQDGQRILDLGAGSGYSLCLDAQKMNEGVLVGVDLSFENCVQIRSRLQALTRGKKIRYFVIAGLLEKTPLPGNSFDIVKIEMVLHHLPDPMEGLKEAYRLLSPGGILIISTLGKDYQQHLPRWKYKLQRGIKVFDLKELKNLLTKGFGLEVLDQYSDIVIHRFSNIYDYLRFEIETGEASMLSKLTPTQLRDAYEPFSKIFTTTPPLEITCEYITLALKKLCKESKKARKLHIPVCKWHMQPMRLLRHRNYQLYQCKTCIRRGYQPFANYRVVQGVIWSYNVHKFKM